MKTPKSNSKRNLKLIILLVFSTLALRNAEAAIVNITVDNLAYNPTSVNANIGDKIIWTLSGSESNSVICDGVFPGTSLPAGAVSWNALLSSDKPEFEYVVLLAGTYNYTSEFHSFVMSGSISVESTLPVELTDFVATTIKNEVILDWSTGGEINNAKFEVQRIRVGDLGNNYPDNLEFITIGVLYGNGNINHYYDYRFVDKNLKSGVYKYRLRQVDYNSNFIYHLLSKEIVIGVPDKFNLSQNYPNPFNPVTKINFELPFDGNVNITLLDASGKEVSTVKNEFSVAGYHTSEIDGSSLPSGVYFYRLQFTNGDKYQTATKKMMLLK